MKTEKFMSFYERLKLLADEQSSSFNQIERDLGYPRNALSNYKQGKEPSARRLSELSRYFSVSKDYLLGESETKGVLSVATQLEGMLDGLTDSRRNEVMLFVNEKIAEQNDEANLVFNRMGTVEAMEVKSINGIDAFKQGRPNLKVSIPFDEIPKSYDVALVISDLNFPFIIRSFAESFLKSGDVIFITFPKGVYNPNISTYEFAGMTFIESTNVNGEIIYVRDTEYIYGGEKNTAVLAKIYHAK
ncbi:MAG: helix-turn-helix transcriptional regulator [Streptococcaceae bacterium]|jgi:transcriptional regulator with XRE-family HTH domain|nr:helix-turn-helix transcriptional regulator [Streptococcaceae bacterium]